MRLRHGESGDGNNAQQNLGHAMKDAETEGLAQLRHGESGQTTVVMTLILATFLLGFIAFGIDIEALFHAKRQAQAAADGAAIAAAEESPQDIPSELAAAQAVAKLNGFDTTLAVNPAVVTINQTPLSGNYTTAAAGTYLEVIVSQPIRLFFAGLITHKTTMVVAARAVAAAGQASPTCVCLLGTTGTDLNMSNNAQLTPTGCGTTVDSIGTAGSPSVAAITIVGSATLGGVSIGSVDPNWDTTGNVNNGGSVASGTKVVQGLLSGCSPPTPKIPDPSTYADAECGGDPSTSGHYYNGSSFIIGPGSLYSTTQSTADGNVTCYTSLTVGANSDTEYLNPGIYIIKNGPLTFASNGNTGGSGVTFFLYGTASLTIANGANVNLIAPTTGTYNGYVVIQDPGNSSVVPARPIDNQPITIAGGANTSFKGAVFAPAAAVTLSNGSGTSIGADIVANTLTMNGGGTLNATPKASFGSFNISTAKLTE